MELGADGDLAPMEMEPPSKRRRGRPKKIVSETLEPNPEPGSEPGTETSRFPGRMSRRYMSMSLRPNRRVDVRKGGFSNLTRKLRSLKASANGTIIPSNAYKHC